MKQKKVIIIGAGEGGFVIANILRLANCRVVGWLDDKKSGSHILGPVSKFKTFSKNCCFFVSIGDNAGRRRIFTRLQRAQARFVNAIHPTARIESSVTLGTNIMVGAFSYVNVNSSIGDNTFINNGCIVEHDNHVGAHSHLAPGVVTGGGVKIGNETFIGLGSVLRDHITIGDRVVIGMGSVIVKSVASNKMVFNALKLKQETI